MHISFALFHLILAIQSKTLAAQQQQQFPTELRPFWHGTELDPEGRLYVGRSYDVGLGFPRSGNASLAIDGTGCVVTNSSTPLAFKVSCSQPGSFLFTIQWANSSASSYSTFYATFYLDFGCYFWSWTQSGSDRSGVRLYLSADHSSSLSMDSFALTSLFESRGGLPRISTLSPGVAVSSIIWDSTGFWNVTLFTLRPINAALTVSGNGVSIMSCGIRSTQLYVPLDYSLSPSLINTSLLLSGNFSSYVPMRYHACSLIPLATRASYVNPSLTRSILLSSTVAPTNFSVIDLTFYLNGTLIDIAAFPSNFLLLSSQGLSRLDLKTGNISPITLQVSDFTSLQIRTSPHCDGISYAAVTYFQSLNDLAIIFSTLPSPSLSIWISTNQGQSFSKYSLNMTLISDAFNYSSISDSISIMDVATSSTLSGVTVFIRNTKQSNTTIIDGIIQIAQIFTIPVTSIGFVFPMQNSSTTASPFLRSSSTGTADLFIYRQNQLYYSPNDGMFFVPVQLANRDSRSTGQLYLTYPETIVDLLTSNEGSFSAITSQNRLFYGYLGLPQTFELMSGLSPQSASSFYFDSFGDLYALSSDDNFISRRISVENQLESPVAPSDLNSQFSCPYLTFSSDIFKSFYLDTFESINITSTITYDTSASSLFYSSSPSQYFSLSFSNKSLLSVTEMTGSNGYGSISLTTSLSARGTSMSGRTQIRVDSSLANLACDDVFFQSLALLECPPRRHISVVYDISNPRPILDSRQFSSMANSGCQSLADQFSFTVNAGTWIDFANPTQTQSDSKTGIYDCSKYGPPLPYYYSTEWKPVVGLFEEPTNSSDPSDWIFLKFVDADFVLLDINGRNSIGYNTTVGSTNCKYAPQSWSQYLSEFSARSSSGLSAGLSTPIDLWTRDTYVHCNSTSTPLDKTAKSKPYNILSSSNQNAIQWGGDVDGYYVLQIRILDPSFSYCDLTTYVGVNVYGAPLGAGLQAGIIIGFLVSVGAILFTSFFWLRNTRKMTALMNLNPSTALLTSEATSDFSQ